MVRKLKKRNNSFIEEVKNYKDCSYCKNTGYISAIYVKYSEIYNFGYIGDWVYFVCNMCDRQYHIDNKHKRWDSNGLSEYYEIDEKIAYNRLKENKGHNIQNERGIYE